MRISHKTRLVNKKAALSHRFFVNKAHTQDHSFKEPNKGKGDQVIGNKGKDLPDRVCVNVREGFVNGTLMNVCTRKIP